MTEPTASEAARITELDAALRRLAHAALIAPDEREDVVQEAWVARLRRGVFAAPREHGWLRATLHNVARDRRRKRLNRAARERDWGLRRGNADAPAEDIAAGREIARALQAAVEELDEPFRTPVRLRFLEELSVTEIAARLARPPSTVKSQVQEGLARLRMRLERRFGERPTWQAAFATWLAGGQTEFRPPAVSAGPAPAPRLPWRRVWLIAASIPVAAALFVLRGSIEPDERPAMGTLARPPSAAGDPPKAVGAAESAREPVQPAPAMKPTGTTQAAAAPAANLELHVRSAASGRPVADAEVTLLIPGRRMRMLGRSDAGGRFTARIDPAEFASDELLGNLSGPRPCLIVRAGGYAHSPTFMPCWDGETGARFTAHLEHAAPPIRGRVVDADERPVPGARVLLEPLNRTSDRDERGTVLADVPRPIVLDTTGRFTIEDAPHGPFALAARATGFLTERATPFFADGAPRELTLRLVRAPVLRGQVFAPDGTPLSRARVGYHIAGSDPVATLSDEEGFYELALAASEVTVVSAEAPAFRWRASTVVEGRRADDIEWDARLEASPGLRVRVTDLEGRPARGVELHLYVPHLTDHVGAWLATDADGRAETYALDALEHEARLFPHQWPQTLPVLVVSGLHARTEPYEIQLPDLVGGPRTVEGMLDGFDPAERESMLVHAGRPGATDLGSVSFERDTGHFRSLGNLPGPFYLVVHAQQRGRLDLGPFEVGPGPHTELGRIARPALARLRFLWPPASEGASLRVATAVEAGGIGVPVEVARFGPQQAEARLYPNLYCLQLFQGDLLRNQIYVHARSAESLEVECHDASVRRTRLRVGSTDGAPARGRLNLARATAMGSSEPVFATQFDLASGDGEWRLELAEGRYEASAEAVDGRRGVLQFEIGSKAPLEPVYHVELRER
jgi:RNA polymerase sigma-70 factor (ECF subfamily)